MSAGWQGWEEVELDGEVGWRGGVLAIGGHGADVGGTSGSLGAEELGDIKG